MNDTPNPLKGWHLDKRVPIALILALALQTLGFAAWVGGLNERVNALEARQTGMEDVRERMVRLETLMETLIARIDRQEGRQ